MRRVNKRIASMAKKCVATAALITMLGTSTTAMAADITVTPVQASFLTKANTVVYLTADLSTPTECVLPENFQINVTGVSNTGFWEIEINGVKFYIVGDAVKTDAAEAEATPAPAQTPAIVTAGMKNAVKKAQSYIKYSGFSRQRLIDQLAYEGFTAEECIYGADNCGANWTLECVENAKSYIRSSGFSRQKLIEQLTYEGFSAADCLYAVDNCGADWNTECVEKAQSYMRYSGFSRQRLIEQLAYEGFTQEQIAYGIAAVGY